MRSSHKKEATPGTHIEIDTLEPRWLIDRLRPLPPNPVAVIDIDSTIMDTAPRNRSILQAAAKQFPEIAAIVPGLTDGDLGWGVAAKVAREAGLTAGKTHELERFWAERFFSNRWLACDCPYPGVRRFLRWLQELGLVLVYLTGRDKPNMSDGTISSFRSHGLPTGPNTEFLFKPAPADDDIAFKQRAIETVERIGTVVLAIDNEPGNANTFRRSFPDAVVLLMVTVTSPEPEPLAGGIHTFKRYASL
ncbi:MAG: HAD family hydrolase [Spirochaetaceae bacterium]